MKGKFSVELTSAALHILAMALMLCNHLWVTLIPGNDWMDWVGRLAFPIFAFLLAEGCRHTRDMKKYILRMLVFALISEIPFNLVAGGSIFYPVHQNVLWSFLIALVTIHWNEKGKASGKLWKRLMALFAMVVVGPLVALFTMVDYYHAGVFMVLLFYLFPKPVWWCRLAQLVLLWLINREILGGVGSEFILLGQRVFLTRQSLAVLALIPIWLYRGKQGCQSKGFRYFCYSFYPAHLLVLGLLRLI